MSLKSLEFLKDEYSPNYVGVYYPEDKIIWWISRRELKQLYIAIGKELKVEETK